MILEFFLLEIATKAIAQCLIEVQPPARRLQDLPEVPIPQVPLPRIPITPRVSLENLLDEEWRAFKMTYNKHYSTPEEEALRKEIFIANRHKIAILNQQYADGLRNFVAQLNPYSDMLTNEFNKMLNGFNRASPNRTTRAQLPKATSYLPSANVGYPESVDWREQGAVTPVKSQGRCAACWAFAAAGALEGHQYRKSGSLIELSPQNLIDCTEPLGNDGCQGGLLDVAFEYIRENPGINREENYPFESADATCRFRPEDVASDCTGYVTIPEGQEGLLEAAVATQGPVAAAMDAGRESFQHYSDGVYYEPECSNDPQEMNHAVLIVGYGVEPDGQKYWLVKNSYGPQWGLGGYVKMARGRDNHCGIANQAIYPLV